MGGALCTPTWEVPWASLGHRERDLDLACIVSLSPKRTVCFPEYSGSKRLMGRLLVLRAGGGGSGQAETRYL